MKSVFLVVSEDHTVFGTITMPAYPPYEDAKTIEEAYASFSFATEAEAAADAKTLNEDMAEAVARGDLTDFETCFVVQAQQTEDGTILLADELEITLKDIYEHFGMDLPEWI